MRSTRNRGECTQKCTQPPDCGSTISLVTSNIWWEYVRSVAGPVKQQEIAARADIDQSHFSRWKAGHAPTVGMVAKFARAYGVNVLEALVAAGMITEAEADLREVRVADLSTLSDDEFIAELRRRFRP